MRKSVDRKKTATYKSVEELQLFDLVDAKDCKGKWYKGMVIDEKYDRKSKELRKKVHFFGFKSNHDEYYANDNIDKIAPFLTFCEEEPEQFYSLDVVHCDLSRRGSF
jgi:hypothetical protein